MRHCLIPALMLILMLAMGCGGPGKGPGGPPPDGQAPPQEGMDRVPQAPAKESTPQELFEKRIQDLTQVLELTPEQTVQVRDILGRAEVEKETIQPEGGRWDSPEAMSIYFLRLRQVDQRATEELGKVLSKDQLEDYQEYLEDQRARFGRKNGGGGGSKRPDTKPKPRTNRD